MSNAPFAAASHFRHENVANLSPMETLCQDNAMSHEAMVWAAFDPGNCGPSRKSPTWRTTSEGPGPRRQGPRQAWWVARAKAGSKRWTTKARNS